MRKILVLAAALAAISQTAFADVWDVSSPNDNANSTRNELVHGADQTHDLGVLAGPFADQDWYVLLQKPRASYEVIVDSTSADLGVAGPVVERLSSDGVTVLQASLPIGAGASRSLAWENATGAAVLGYVRIRSGACTTDCGPEDVYRVRLRETTGFIPRFNNSGTQVSVLALKNAAALGLSGHVDFWDGAGALRATQAFAIPANGSVTVNTATLPALAGVSGSVTVSHDGRYGDLVGKAAAVEPATGFVFDTALLSREPPRSACADGTTSFCNSPFGCPGYGQATANVTCAAGQCGFSCVGENYDVDGQEADGCEILDAPLGNHTQGTATFLGSLPCDDGGSAINVLGLLPSDARVHELPPVGGFVPATGSAPDWVRVHASGGLCVNDVFLQLQVTGSAFPTCYSMTVITSNLTASCTASSNGYCSIDPGSGSYSDDTDIYFSVQKNCDTTSVESVPYTVTGHL